ncbi:retrovirus-related Pol polyprotein from transposon opus [Trichonephila clavipes]|nr:retrovirus-related Pol polyprotein from transposon opus [Trichonephila clavipes]
MDQVLSPHHNYCRSYIDDVAVFSETWSDHLQHLEGVFKTLRAVGLTVNIEKCDFGKSQVKFLGHLVGSGKTCSGSSKVETMSKLLRPTTKKQLRGLIGLASYYRDYIKNFSSIVLPLTNLTKKNIPNNIPWDDTAEESFQCLKKSLIEMPTLYTPVLNRPFQLYTDASATIVGACLAQNDENGMEHPIAFYSRKLTTCQMNWSTIEREAYAVLSALKNLTVGFSDPKYRLCPITTHLHF